MDSICSMFFYYCKGKAFISEQFYPIKIKLKIYEQLTLHSLNP